MHYFKHSGFFHLNSFDILQGFTCNLHSQAADKKESVEKAYPFLNCFNLSLEHITYLYWREFVNWFHLSKCTGTGKCSLVLSKKRICHFGTWKEIAFLIILGNRKNFKCFHLNCHNSSLKYYKEYGSRWQLWKILSLPSPVALCAKLLQPCPTLCDPIDGSPPGTPIPGILQARTLEWIAISLSNA